MNAFIGRRMCESGRRTHIVPVTLAVSDVRLSGGSDDTEWLPTDAAVVEDVGRDPFPVKVDDVATNWPLKPEIGTAAAKAEDDEQDEPNPDAETSLLTSGVGGQYPTVVSIPVPVFQNGEDDVTSPATCSGGKMAAADRYGSRLD